MRQAMVADGERTRAVGLGAIVVIGPGAEHASVLPERGSFLSRPLAYFDVLGRSTAERVIERFVRADVDVVTVLQPNADSGVKACFTAFENVEFHVANDVAAELRQKLQEYSRNGIEHSFLILGNVYAETDLLDLYYFHREARQAATRAMDRDGALDLWVLDCAKAHDQDVDLQHLREWKTSHTSYFIREYVNRLADPRDLRRFASDLLRGRCSPQPLGREVKRGIWIDDGAEVHRRARLVAPAYIGRGTKIMEDTLVTRFSNVEKDCCVNYGTVIEDSSILQSTEIGICLDVCHAVANGNKLLKLDRNVVIEITDANVMRPNGQARGQGKDRNKWSRRVLMFSGRKQRQQPISDLQPAASAPKPRRLQANSI
jgi:NDP-sugar pyrophosphorylase family protein